MKHYVMFIREKFYAEKQHMVLGRPLIMPHYVLSPILCFICSLIVISITSVVVECVVVSSYTTYRSLVVVESQL